MKKVGNHYELSEHEQMLVEKKQMEEAKGRYEVQKKQYYKELLGRFLGLGYVGPYLLVTLYSALIFLAGYGLAIMSGKGDMIINLSSSMSGSISETGSIVTTPITGAQ